MDMTVEGKGVGEPRHRHRVKAEMAGIIQQIHVRPGQQVEKGQPLVTLDNTEFATGKQIAQVCGFATSLSPPILQQPLTTAS